MTTRAPRSSVSNTRRRFLPALGLTAGLVATALTSLPPVNAAPVDASAPATPGFVAGEAKPAGEGPMVQVPGGWMVAYEETIPGTDVGFRMIPVPGGNFRMGSVDGEEGRSSDEGPAFEVAVLPFWIGEHEVTWAEYKRYMAACDLFIAMQSAKIRPIDEANQADAVTAPSNLYDPTTTFTNGEEPNLPAVSMTQFAARQYTKWLSRLTGRFYRLPAESEWEYACRAGSDTPFSCGGGDDLEAFAWFADNADDTTHPVGEKKPNAFGLYDMHGNAAEWVVDELVAGGYAMPAALDQPVAAAVAIQWPERLYPRSAAAPTTTRPASAAAPPAGARGTPAARRTTQTGRTSIPTSPRAPGGTPRSRPWGWVCGWCGPSPSPNWRSSAAGGKPTSRASRTTSPAGSRRAAARRASSTRSCRRISGKRASRNEHGVQRRRPGDCSYAS
jgi:sulfatase modifying factor 1